MVILSLSLVMQWIEKVIGWLSRVFLQGGAATQPNPEANSTLKRWRCHVQRFFYRIYASMRIEELFSIIRGKGVLALALQVASTSYPFLQEFGYSLKVPFTLYK